MPKEPTTEQSWALFKMKEYNYRQLFGLSKLEMEQEPIEDFVVNQHITYLYNLKSQRNNKRKL